MPEVVVDLKVPFLSQRDNKYYPGGTCNTTCVAMAMRYFGIVGDGSGQLEDQLTQKCLKEGWDRHDPQALAELFKWKGLEDDFSYTSSWENIQNHLQAGLGPVIVHGWFTRSGHIVLIRGFVATRKGQLPLQWIVNDPFGEWFADGYQHYQHADGRWMGNREKYSRGMMQKLCSADGQLWAHLIWKKPV